MTCVVLNYPAFVLIILLYSLRPSDTYICRRQAIICTSTGIFANRILRNKHQWNFNRNSNIFVQDNTFESVVCEMAAILPRLHCVICGCRKGNPILSLRWRHNEHDGVSNHQPHGCLLNRLFRRRLKKTSKLRVTGFCVGNSPGTGEFPAQRASYAENVPIWWRHHVNDYAL